MDFTHADPAVSNLREGFTGPRPAWEGQGSDRARQAQTQPGPHIPQEASPIRKVSLIHRFHPPFTPDCRRQTASGHSGGDRKKAALEAKAETAAASMATAARAAEASRLQLNRRWESGTPGKIRTCDLWFRRPTLYPTELRALRMRAGTASPPFMRRPHLVTYLPRPDQMASGGGLRNMISIAGIECRCAFHGAGEDRRCA